MVKDGSSFSVCNFPRLPSSEKHPTVVFPLAGLPTIAARLQKELKGHRGALRSFADLTECEAAHREGDRQIFGERIRRGLCRRFRTRMEADPHPGEPMASDDAFVLRPENKSFLDGSDSHPLGLVKTVKRRQQGANAFPYRCPDFHGFCTRRRAFPDRFQGHRGGHRAGDLLQALLRAREEAGRP